MKRIPDVIRPGLSALFVGINPDPISFRERHHFANPQNPFWRLLYESGFTRTRLAPRDEASLLAENLGITNFIPRPSHGISELGRDDIEKGRAELVRKVLRYRPSALVFVGISGYRMFRGKGIGDIQCGEQPLQIAGARVFVLPHPSGRNVHFRREDMLALWRLVASSLGYSAPSTSLSP